MFFWLFIKGGGLKSLQLLTFILDMWYNYVIERKNDDPKKVISRKGKSMKKALFLVIVGLFVGSTSAFAGGGGCWSVGVSVGTGGCWGHPCYPCMPQRYYCPTVYYAPQSVVIVQPVVVQQPVIVQQIVQQPVVVQQSGHYEDQQVQVQVLHPAESVFATTTSGQRIQVVVPAHYEPTIVTRRVWVPDP